MGPHTEYPRSALHGKREKLWDPSKVLGIENTDPGYQHITCAGYAPSQRRRCRNPIRKDNRDFIEATLDEMAYLQPDSSAVASRLRTIAGPALCVRYHQNQAETIVQQWQHRIKHMKPQRERAPSGVAQVTVKPDQALKEAHEQLRELRKNLAELQGRLQDLESKPQGRLKAESQQEEDDKLKARERQQREEKDRQAKREEKERKEKEERKEREIKEEEERKEKEQREKERAEREECEKRQREREQRKAREETARKERDRLAREAARRERAEWDLCWSQYQSRWADFLANPAARKGQKLSDVVPWPVRSGLYRDVKASTVKEFMRTAPPREEGQEVNMAKLMRKECAKWHPDRVDGWLKKWRPEVMATQVVTVAEKMVMEAISRAVTDLLNEVAARKADLEE